MNNLPHATVGDGKPCQPIDRELDTTLAPCCAPILEKVAGPGSVKFVRASRYSMADGSMGLSTVAQTTNRSPWLARAVPFLPYEVLLPAHIL